MTTIAPLRSTPTRPDPKVVTWTHRSLWMLPAFLVAFFVTGVVGEYVVLPRLGLNEGDLMLMQRGVAGWVCEVGFALVLAAPAVAGIVFAVAALRRSAHVSAWVALIANAALATVVLYMFLDAVHMTYYPQGGWLWF